MSHDNHESPEESPDSPPRPRGLLKKFLWPIPYFFLFFMNMLPGSAKRGVRWHMLFTIVMFILCLLLADLLVRMCFSGIVRLVADYLIAAYVADLLLEAGSRPPSE